MQAVTDATVPPAGPWVPPAQERSSGRSRGRRRRTIAGPPQKRHPLLSRPVIVVYAVLGSLLLGVAVAYLALGKTVRITVDGKSAQVRTFATSVGGALEDAGVRTGKHDIVQPAATARLHHDAKIVVRHARPLTITVDGQKRTVWVTALNVGEALDQLRMRHEGAILSASRMRVLPLEGFVLDMRTARRVVVLAGQVRVETVTTSGTVREVLQAERLTVGKGDKVTPALDTFPAEGTVIRIVGPAAAKAAPEAPGPRKAIPASVRSLNWAGLAKCESGGRPTAVNRAGPYYGLYQFSLPTWRSVGGTKTPIEWPADEQTYRAQLLYMKVNGRWRGQWPHCGRYLGAP